MDGFIDASELLKGGVYLLLYKREVVYVGKAKRMLTRVYSHLHIWSSKRRGKTPSWLPIDGVYFDEVYIRPCHPDQIDALEREMISLYKPRLNTKLKTPGPTTIPFTLTVGSTTLAFNKPPVAVPHIERRV